MKNAAGDEVTELGELPLKDRRCPDCSEPRIVGHPTDDREELYCWTCVSSDCPPTRLRLEGVVGSRPFDFHEHVMIGHMDVADGLLELRGKRVVLTVSVFGEPPTRSVAEPEKGPISPEGKAAMSGPGSGGAAEGLSVEKKPRRRRNVAKNG